MNHVLDDKGNKIEGLSKEEMLAVLQQAIDNGSLTGIDTDSAFVSKLKCCVGGETHYMGFVTQAKFNELKANGQLRNKAIYFITDDTTAEDFESNVEALNERARAIETTIDTLNEQIKPKVLWSNENGATSASWEEELQIGDIVEVTYKVCSSITTQKCIVYQYSPNSKQGILRVREDWGNKSIGVDKYATAEIIVYQKVASGYIINSNVLSTGDSVTIYKVEKVNN
jgi:hypothetical protein